MAEDPGDPDLDETVTRIVADARRVLVEIEGFATYAAVQALKRRIHDHIQRLIDAAVRDDTDDGEGNALVVHT